MPVNEFGEPVNTDHVVLADLATDPDSAYGRIRAGATNLLADLAAGRRAGAEQRCSELAAQAADVTDVAERADLDARLGELRRLVDTVEPVQSPHVQTARALRDQAVGSGGDDVTRAQTCLDAARRIDALAFDAPLRSRATIEAMATELVRIAAGLKERADA